MSKIVIVFFACIFLADGYAHDGLVQINNFGANPGNIELFYYRPLKTRSDAPMVVLLHGCNQSATDIDNETGWIKLAEENGFILMFPQQKRENNLIRCFNWFNPTDFSRLNGEAKSIEQMIEQMKKNFSIDPRKIYIAGLSAGGAMTSVMISTFPEIFSAAGIVAGIPFGCATNSVNAWSCMAGSEYPTPSAQEWGEFVRNVDDNYHGHWPRVMIVHGTKDDKVSYKNGRFLIDQWTNVHGVDNIPDSSSSKAGALYEEYKKNDKTVVVSLLSIPEFKHGYPIDSSHGCGEEGRYVLNTGVCASEFLARFFKLIK